MLRGPGSADPWLDAPILTHLDMSPRNRIAALCIGLNALVEIGVGVVYLVSREVMPYHKAVLGVGWDQLEPGVRTMLVAFLNAYGSAHLGVGLALAALVLVPMRKAQPWARWAALAVGLPVLGTTALVSFQLARIAEPGPPWRGALALFLIFLAGVAVYQPRAAAGGTP